MLFRSSTGLTLTETFNQPGHYQAFLDPSPGASLVAPAELLWLEFRGFIGDSLQSDLPFTIVPRNTPCVEISSRPGHIRIDSICGMSFRMIEALPGIFSLAQNHPNPFNRETAIDFSLAAEGPVILEILDPAGREVSRPIDAILSAGKYSARLDARDLPSGVYSYRLRAGEYSEGREMVVVK